MYVLYLQINRYCKDTICFQGPFLYKATEPQNLSPLREVEEYEILSSNGLPWVIQKYYANTAALDKDTKRTVFEI